MPSRAQRESLAEAFFRSPNRIDWDEYQSGRLPAATAARVTPWIDRLLCGADPVMLPFAQSDGTTWYAVAETSRAYRHLREELKSFLGRSYSDFDGQPTHMDPSLPSERALTDCYGRHVIRLHVRSEHREVVARRLALFLRLRDAAPERGDSVPRPTGRILADFHEALRLGDDPEADRCIGELECNGQLDAQNLLYLRILAQEARGYWQGIVDAAHRYRLLQALPRPRHVGQAVLRAIYATEWVALEVRQDATGALARFREVGSYVEPLLVARSLYDCPEADALFVMSAVARAGTRSSAAAVLDAVAPGAGHRPWLERLIGTLPEPALEDEAGPPRAIDALVEARNAHFDGDLDRAWRLASGLAPAEAATQLVIRCALDLGTLEVAEFALRAFEELSNDAQKRLEARNSIASALQVLRGLLAPAAVAQSAAARGHVPQSWVQWAQALLAEQHWSDASEVARRGCDEWEPAEFASPERATELAELLSRLDEIGWARISESLPYMLSSLGRCASLPRQMGHVLEQLTSIHLMDEAPGRLFFSTLASLCDLTLLIGTGDQAYGQLLRDCLSAITNAGAADFEGLLDLFDVLVTHAAPDTALRAAVGGAIARLFVRFKRKADSSQLFLLVQLLVEADCELPAPLRAAETDSDTRQALASLAGKTIALYSLKENALRRVATILESIVPGVRTTSFHDKAGGSRSLRAAARNADVFVMATAAASHAATRFIEAERPVGAPILKPAGQGSASMLRSLREFADAAGHTSES